MRTTHPIGNRAPHYAIDHFEKNPRYFVEDHPALLDADGEWYLDRDQGILLYRPLPGEHPQQVEVVAPDLDNLLVIRGRPHQPVRNVHFRGIAFEHCHWSTPPEGYASGQSTVHERRDGSRKTVNEK